MGFWTPDFENSLSKLANLSSGVPQGGILSPLLYIIYVSDFEDWLVRAKASTYADDSGTGVKGNSTSEIIPKLEEDGENVLNSLH